MTQEDKSCENQMEVPARMVNEFVYCPRLAYLEWLQGEWADSYDTLDGSYQHRRVDVPGGDLPDPAAETPTLHARSVLLSSPSLGVCARIDLVLASDGCVQPVDYKRGKRPHVERGAYDPERVQLCVQGLLLRERGYSCDSGLIYYVASKEKVLIPFDEELLATTHAAIAGIKCMARTDEMPEPLSDSPKCPRCSLAPICMPDELNWLKQQSGPVRPLAVAQSESMPLYVQEHGASLRKSGETLEIWVERELKASVRLVEISQVALFGSAHISTPLLGELLQREIPVTFLSYGGWFYGHAHGLGHKNAQLREAQYRTAFQPEACLNFARSLVAAKIQNCRTLLRRNGPKAELIEALQALNLYRQQARRAGSSASLLGVEGIAARSYFQHLSLCFKQPGSHTRFDFSQRNRRPPQDPVNALLSLAYSLLVRSFSVAATAVGLDLYRGFYHSSRWGRPALALDLMEPFRPLLADSCVLSAINNGEIQPDDFQSARTGILLKPAGRKRLIAAFERRLSQEVTHPLFGYRLSYRRLLELHCRLFGRFLLGEMPQFPHFVTR